MTAAIYTTYGGLKSVAWADLFQGTALIVGGLMVMLAGLRAVGGWDAFVAHNADRLHMILPADHPELPWTALLFGLWIPNLYYWGFNQYITQRTLAARSLRHGQLGVLMAGAIQLILPAVIVFPGLMARQLYPDALAATPDKAYPLLIKNLIGSGFRGFVFAAIAGAVISTLASMLNSAATIFTIDVYQRRLRRDAPAKTSRGDRPRGHAGLHARRLPDCPATGPLWRDLQFHAGSARFHFPRDPGRFPLRVRRETDSGGGGSHRDADQRAGVRTAAPAGLRRHLLLEQDGHHLHADRVGDGGGHRLAAADRTCEDAGQRALRSAGRSADLRTRDVADRRRLGALRHLVVN